MSQLPDQIIAALAHSFKGSIDPDCEAQPCWHFNFRSKPGKLCGHVVNGADEDAVPLERHLVLVLVGVVQAEWLVDRGALVHELDGTTRIGRDVADGNKTGGEMRAARRGLDPRDSRWAQKLLCVRDAQQAWGLWRPVDAIHYDRTVGGILVGKVADVSFRVLVELVLVISSPNLSFKLI